MILNGFGSQVGQGLEKDKGRTTVEINQQSAELV